MSFLCKFLLWSSLCCLLAMPIQAQAMGPSSSATTRGSLDRFVAVGLGSTPIPNAGLEV
jgi:hypothetical protein